MKCPRCGKGPMIEIEVDMTEQGGPPANSWLCADQSCGRAIQKSGNELKPKWIFERGVFDHGIPEKMLKIAREKGMEAIEVVFSEGSEFFTGILDVKKQKKLPFGDKDCVVMYGSFHMARYLLRSHPWIPGVWFDVDALSCKTYYSHWGRFLLQQSYAMMPLVEVARQREWAYETFGKPEAVFGPQSIFIRPDSQLKPFAGQVVLDADFNKFYSEAMIYGSPETLAVIAAPQDIKNEWRLVIADREVLTGSGYIRGGDVIIHDGFPEGARDLATRIANASEWQPHPIYCMDICQTGDEKFHLLEIGSVNTCGMYDCDLEKIITKSSEIAEREWLEAHN